MKEREGRRENECEEGKEREGEGGKDGDEGERRREKAERV